MNANLSSAAYGCPGENENCSADISSKNDATPSIIITPATKTTMKISNMTQKTLTTDEEIAFAILRKVLERRTIRKALKALTLLMARTRRT